jgi:hypothetical protein
MKGTVVFSDLALSQRLERAEGFACAQFAVARSRLFPSSGAEWMECAGATVVFDGIEWPTTQTFGLGLFEELTPSALGTIERFFLDRGTTPMHEVSPMAGAQTLDLLCARNYRPFEISNVLYRSVEEPCAAIPDNIRVHVIGAQEADLWSNVNARGWVHDHPEYEDFLKTTGQLLVARQDSPCFLAEIDGQPAAAGGLCLHRSIALFAGASTVPEHRCRGLQAALLEARMRYAFEHGCDLAMMVAQAGSNSQRNAERKGFRVAYTRLKWKLMCELPARG